MKLPDPSPEETSLLQAMRSLLHESINQADGALPFDRYMELCLYAPGLGYYVNGRRRFGEDGDFTTAPELSPDFGACVANWCAEQFLVLDRADVLEFGAGSGRLAVDVLRRLETLDRLPERYCILELSPDLRRQQAETLEREVPGLADRVLWLDRLPERGFRGVVLGNELLDAMPVSRFRRDDRGDWQELCVTNQGDSFADRWVEPRTQGFEESVQAIWGDGDVPAPGYESEINLRLGPWLDALAARVDAAAVLLIDYGYSAHEFYHPERSKGTLICHYRHRAYADPYRLPGLQDMTANVDFTALAKAGVAAGFEVAGYTTQAHFLLDAGLDQLLAESDPGDVVDHVARMQGIKKLTLPSEMGERFKVMALSYGCAPTDLGFRMRDLRDRL
jgi:SAM-dependent MidA family methyltransferase